MNVSNKARVSLLLTAGGVGSRMASSKPKQFIEVSGQPIIAQTLMAFSKSIILEEIVVTLPKTHLNEGRELLLKHAPDVKLSFVVGGSTRSTSVINGLNAFEKSSDIVLIHDAVRPFVSKDLLGRVIERCEKGKGVVPVVRLKDSLRKITDSGSLTSNREDYRLVQTPQAFFLDELKAAYNGALSHRFTDDASLFESTGGRIILVEGSYQNIKITNPLDLLLAQVISDQGF